MRINWEELVQMTTLLNFKEKLKIIYSRNSIYINPGVKFLSMLVSLLVMTSYIGYSSLLKNPFVAVIISAICAFLPVNFMVVIYSLVMLANLYSISAEIAIIVFVFLIIMYCLYFRFSSKYGYVLLLMPVLCFVKLPFMLPLILGIGASPASVVAMIFGIMIFFIMKYGSEEVVLIVNGTASSGVDKMSSFLSKLIGNKELLVLIVVFVITTLVVYGLKRLSINYSSTIGIVTGGIVEVVMILGGIYLFDIDGIFKVWMVCLFTVLSIAIVFVLQFFILAVDYSRTEYTQFVDDDYYYYVKAVPKIKVTATDVRVKHINVKRTRRR